MKHPQSGDAKPNSVGQNTCGSVYVYFNEKCDENCGNLPLIIEYYRGMNGN